MTPILLLGAGGHARSVIDVIETTGAYTIVGLVGQTSEVGTTVLGYPVLGDDDDLPRLLNTHPHALVTLGQIRTPDGRMRLFDLARSLGGELPAITSPRAQVSRHATIGAGTVVMHGAIVNAGATVGRNCIVNSAALVEHDAVIGDHCHISTAAVVNGGVTVGAGSFVGSRSVVRQAIVIGERCVIGMGERVLTDLAPDTWLPERSRK